MYGVRRINLNGGSGIGKSTLAADIFASLKRKHVKIELVSEWVKNWAYEKHEICGWDQHYIFGKQLRREEIFLKNDVKYIVSDSPLYLQCCYASLGDCSFAEDLWNIAKKFTEEYPAVEFLIEREVPYLEEGRYQNYEQAIAVDDFIKEQFEKRGIPFKIEKVSDIKSILIEAYK